MSTERNSGSCELMTYDWCAGTACLPGRAARAALMLKALGRSDDGGVVVVDFRSGLQFFHYQSTLRDGVFLLAKANLIEVIWWCGWEGAVRIQGAEERRARREAPR